MGKLWNVELYLSVRSEVEEKEAQLFFFLDVPRCQDFALACRPQDIDNSEKSSRDIDSSKTLL